MLRARALLLLVPLLGAVAGSARGADGIQDSALAAPEGAGISVPGRVPLAEDLALLASHGRKSRVLAVPVVDEATGYSLCLLYDYARTERLDPITASGLADFDGNRDARNLGLGLRRLLTPRLEFEAVLGHSHAATSTNSAYAGIIYDFDMRIGLGADLGRIDRGGQDDNRLRAFARFYF